MKFTALLVTAAASAATLAAGQALTPTANAHQSAAADYCLRLDSQIVTRGTSGLVIHGRVTNIGRQPLTYTQVMPTLLDQAGNEVFRGSGYLTASPLQPGSSAEFRACETHAPAFSRLLLVFREAGRPIMLKTSKRRAGE